MGRKIETFRIKDLTQVPSTKSIGVHRYRNYPCLVRQHKNRVGFHLEDRIRLQILMHQHHRTTFPPQAITLQTNQVAFLLETPIMVKTVCSLPVRQPQLQNWVGFH